MRHTTFMASVILGTFSIALLGIGITLVSKGIVFGFPSPEIKEFCKVVVGIGAGGFTAGLVGLMITVFIPEKEL